MLLDQRTHYTSQIDLVSILDQRTAWNSLDGQLKAFLLSCKVNELSPFTIINYQQKVGRFIRFCDSLGLHTSSEITTNHARMFLLKLQESCQSVSVHNNYRAIKRFFNWMVEEGILERSPISKIRPPKVARKVIQPFKTNHIKDLLLLCNGNSFLARRNRAIILTFLDTGLRLNELVNIQVRDINLDSETIKIMGKGAKERVVRIGKTVQKAMLRYLLMRNDGLPCLWVNKQRKPLTRWGIVLMIRKLGRRAGFTDVRCSPHTFRHTSATQSLRNGAAIEEVKSLLGHTTLYMTMRYVATINSEDAVIAHRKFSPVDRLGLK